MKRKDEWWKRGKILSGMIMCRATEETDEHEAKTRKRTSKEVAMQCAKESFYILWQMIYTRGICIW